jgi:ABC-type transport system substrate-binding protein
MTEELSGLFNPYYATSGADMEVVGMTQIGMLSTDNKGKPLAGDDEPTVVKAFEVGEHDTVSDTTTYRFVIKNGLKFSDGKPLTMNDVMFNIYEYLDPVYTGSSTMYSIDIVGLQKYRLQQDYSSGGNAEADQLSQSANNYAELRVQELIDVYKKYGKQGTGTNITYSLSAEEMKAKISDEWTITPTYKKTVSADKLTNEEYAEKLLEDYEFTLETFHKELEADYNAAKESYDLTTAPYDEWAKELSNDIFKFFLYEGYITPIYELVDGKKNKLKITGFDGEVGSYDTKEKAIERVYEDKITNSLIEVLSYWGTAGTLKTRFTADALTVILHGRLEDGELTFKSIDGIKSLGHEGELTKVKVAGTEYPLAREHNEDGTPKKAGEYDVLEITINGCDPKAIYNFGFTVAPAHYYGSEKGDGSDVHIDIANEEYGVPWADSYFQSKVIQSQKHVEVPMGAGPYQATNADNVTDPSGSSFWSSSVVYFKGNQNFMFGAPKTEKLRMQVVSSSNALDKLESGEVDFVTPQFTKENAKRLEDMSKKGYESLSSWQLGYGYIGINAGLVENVYVRRAIMAAMQTSLACDYYTTGTCKTISWPMSTVSWAYPYEDRENEKEIDNEHDYTYWDGRAEAVDKIERLLQQGNIAKNSDELSVKFTIAGASITEHPTYAVFKQAAEILNEDMKEWGWDIEVKADSQALTKLSTGSLEVWAAAWGSTVDPDMYQVYHKDSTATSVYAWGYREIKAKQSVGDFEYDTISALSEKIEDARETLVESERTALYQDAMKLVLDLAVELPVYQRMTLYAYNTKTISGLNTKVNPYSSPLEKIWNLELVG